MNLHQGITFASALGIAALSAVALTTSANAAQTTQQTCSAKYQAAKAAGTLNGEKWPAFLSDCAANLNGSGGQVSATKPQAAAATKQTSTAASSSAGGQTTQQKCSAMYQSAKSAGTLNGQKWPAFYSNCAANLNGGTVAAAPMPAPTKTAAKTTSSAAQATPAGHQTTQQICSSKYQAAKAADTLGGQKWPAFLSACSDSIKQYSDSAQPTPPEPSAQMPKAIMPAAVQTTAGMSAGEAAFQQRIHECASEWQQEKSSGTLPNGSKWPQFWSQCNTQLKARM